MEAPRVRQQGPVPVTPAPTLALVPCRAAWARWWIGWSLPRAGTEVFITAAGAAWGCWGYGFGLLDELLLPSVGSIFMSSAYLHERLYHW